MFNADVGTRCEQERKELWLFTEDLVVRARAGMRLTVSTRICEVRAREIVVEVARPAVLRDRCWWQDDEQLKSDDVSVWHMCPGHRNVLAIHNEGSKFVLRINDFIPRGIEPHGLFTGRHDVKLLDKQRAKKAEKLGQVITDNLCLCCDDNLCAWRFKDPATRVAKQRL